MLRARQACSDLTQTLNMFLFSRTKGRNIQSSLELLVYMTEACRNLWSSRGGDWYNMAIQMGVNIEVIGTTWPYRWVLI